MTETASILFLPPIKYDDCNCNWTWLYGKTQNTLDEVNETSGRYCWDWQQAGKMWRGEASISRTVFRQWITDSAHTLPRCLSPMLIVGIWKEQVFNVGALGVENARKVCLLGKEELEHQMGFHFSESTIMVTYHPVTLEMLTAREQFADILSVIDSQLGFLQSWLPQLPSASHIGLLK